MIAHVLLLQPRADLSASERRDFVSAFERVVREIPMVKSVRIGRRIRCGAGYETAMPDAADVLAVIDFDDVDGLRLYLQHEAHRELGLLFGRSFSSALVYDFETGGIDVLEDLV